MGGVFFVKFVIAIPSLVVVFIKPLLAPPSFSMEKVGGAFFLFKFAGNTFRLCRRYCYF
jgi:hypothetical protein